MSTEFKRDEVNPTQTPASKSRIPNVTILNIVLLVGLLVLYALQFLPRANNVSASATENVSAGTLTERITDDGAFHIAYVNSDSLMARFSLAQKMRSDLEADQRRMDNDLKRKQQTWQEDVQSFQRQVQLNMVSQENGQKKEQELMQRQQELIQLNDNYANQLMTKEMEMNRELYNKITNMLERYNQEMNFDYILGFSPGGGILYANQKHDITEEIIKRLNQENEVKK
jgi:outer membrane protein